VRTREWLETSVVHVRFRRVVESAAPVWHSSFVTVLERLRQALRGAAQSLVSQETKLHYYSYWK